MKCMKSFISGKQKYLFKEYLLWHYIWNIHWELLKNSCIHLGQLESNMYRAFLQSEIPKVHRHIRKLDHQNYCASKNWIWL